MIWLKDGIVKLYLLVVIEDLGDVVANLFSILQVPCIKGMFLISFCLFIYGVIFPFFLQIFLEALHVVLGGCHFL